jgi:N-acetyl-1-D-myo-inositol-2-amino-2-deoxy-alpha-D-glucopyranoside deacetylase
VAGVARPPRLYGATWPAGLAARLATELQALGLPHGLWGLDAEAFGVDERSIDTVLDVGAHVPAKLAALRAHRSQLGPDNLLSSVPDELAARVLGREYFVDLRPGGGSRDWLSEMAKLPTSGARGGLLA